jgi:hypothetical protein
MKSGRKSNYRTGRAFELEIAQLFEREGYDVTLATMSQGKYDCVASKTEEDRYYKVHYCVLMQCKTRKRTAKAPPSPQGSQIAEGKQ